MHKDFEIKFATYRRYKNLKQDYHEMMLRLQIIYIALCFLDYLNLHNSNLKMKGDYNLDRFLEKKGIIGDLVFGRKELGPSYCLKTSENCLTDQETEEILNLSKETLVVSYYFIVDDLFLVTLAIASYAFELTNCVVEVKIRNMWPKYISLKYEPFLLDIYPDIEFYSRQKANELHQVSIAILRDAILSFNQK